MPFVASYTHQTTATIPADAWDEAWYAFQSWKGWLQSFPGMQRIGFSARRLEGGDVRLLIRSQWECIEQLEEWERSHWLPAYIIRNLDPPGHDIEEESLEDLS